jgi:hypothetical protein
LGQAARIMAARCKRTDSYVHATIGSGKPAIGGVTAAVSVAEQSGSAASVGRQLHH